MTITPELIEKVARAYCVEMGLDPDETIDQFIGGKMVPDARWITAKWAVQSALAMSRALKSAGVE